MKGDRAFLDALARQLSSALSYKLTSTIFIIIVAS